MRPFGENVVTDLPTFDVLVVGFGPCGAVAAGSLGRLGHKTLVIERSNAVYAKPRAIALDHEIFRHFDNMGLAEAISPHVEPFTASQHFGVEGQVIRRIDMAPAPYPLGYTPSMVFSQPPVETELRRHAGAFPSVSVELDAELVGLVERSEGVEATIRGADERERRVSARYVLGCDGASSTVRQIAGFPLEDLGFDEPWLVVDVRVRAEALAKLPPTSAQFCNPARPVSFIIGPGNHRRWEIMLLPDEDRRQMERPEEVWRLLAPWLAPEDGELWRAASYRFHALVADVWRRGRILIAGDAAHQQPPFFGQGMCQGLRDATNAVWKLDRVLKGTSDESLLDTYTDERKRHTIELTTRIKSVGQTICERNPEAARRRDALALAEGGGRPQTLTRQEIIPPIRAGLIARRESSARGALFPQPWIVTGASIRLLDKDTGAGWRLVIDGSKGRPPENARWAAVRAGFLVVAIAPVGSFASGEPMLFERDGVLAGWFDRHGAVAALVRPDHYVFGAVETFDDLAALVVEAAQRLAPVARTLPLGASA